MPTAPELRIGVVAGATSTDAVALDAHDRLLGSVRVAARPDAARTAAAAVARLIDEAGLQPAHVRAVTLGTGYEMDDIVASQRVRRVAVVRIGAPLTLAVPPLATWPPALRRQVSAGEIVVGGGAEYDGGSMTPLDEDALARFLARVGDRASGVAITAVFSPVAPEHELVAAAVARRELGCAVHVSLSHEISTVGLLERENATVLNAALRGTATQLAEALRAALAEQRVDAELYFAQNDGTIMSADHALRYPALMIAAGPGISMRGAAHLSGVGDAVVLDVGGTSAAVGVLVNGAPRERATATDIAGVRTSLRLPDVARVPFGSGSTIAHEGGAPTLGPGSVGLRVDEEALVFGGSTPTLTDAAVAAGRTRAGTVALGAARRRELLPALAVADRVLTAAVNEAKAAVPGVPLVAVGAGHRLVGDRMDGVSEVICPPDAEVAHAIGAAIAPVSAFADRISPNRSQMRMAALEEARAAAFGRAIDAGADPDTVEIVEVDEVPLTYLVQPAVRIRVRAVGPPG